MPLQLAYAFQSSPNPILASASSMPSVVDLQVMVSNPGGTTVFIERILIEIPMGGNDAFKLSDQVDLPSPTYDASLPWTITATAETVTLVPSSGTQGPITGTILFTLPGIAVNATAGTVPLTITEFAPPAPKVIDDTSCALTKWPSDFPVTDFRADAVHDFDQPATLYWTCGTDTTGYAYSVHSDSWHPRDCLGGGSCYSCADGAAGVQTAPLQDTTVFALDLIKADSSGHLTIVSTLYTTVQMSVPKIQTQSWAESLFGTGQIVRLHWIANDASSCSLWLDTKPVASGLPTDTYLNGYTFVLPSTPGNHQITLEARALSGSATDHYNFPLVSVTAASTGSPLQGIATGLAFSADGGSILVTCDQSLGGGGQAVSVVNAGTLAVSNTIPAGQGPGSLVMAGSRALVTSCMDGALLVIDPTATAPVASINVGGHPLGLGATADHTLGLTFDVDDGWITVAELSQGTVAGSVAIGTANVTGAAALPGAAGMLVAFADGTVCLMKVVAAPTTFSVSWQTVGTIAGNPMAMSVAPNGNVALIAAVDATTVSVVDLVGLTIMPATIAVGQMPSSVAIAPNGMVALVANVTDRSVSVIDMPSLTCMGTITGLPGSPAEVAISLDGSQACVGSVQLGGVTSTLILL